MIFTLLATIGGAIAAGASTVATTAVAVGGAVAAGAAAAGTAIAGLGASALAAASSIGAMTLIGGITVAGVVKAAGLIFVGVIISDSRAEEKATRAYERGYENASKSYEAKLRKQAEEFFNQMAQAKREIDEYRGRAETAERLAYEAIELVKEMEGCINGLNARGVQIDGETAGYYQQLKEVRSHIRAA